MNIVTILSSVLATGDYDGHHVILSILANENEKSFFLKQSKTELPSPLFDSKQDAYLLSIIVKI